MPTRHPSAALDVPALLALAAQALERGEGHLRSILGGLAQAQRQGTLDALQGPAYRTAHAHAQAWAARQMLAHAEQSAPQGRLAAAFAARVLGHLREVLPPLAQAVPGVGALPRWSALERDVLQVLAQTEQPAFHQALLESLPQAAQGDGLSGELRLLRESFRSFADKRVRPLAEAWHRQDQLIPDDLIREAAALGCFGLSIPLAYGGAQERPDTLGMVVVTEELCRGALAFGSLITRPEILARALLKGGTEAQRQAFLPAMASGEKMVAISVTEPDFGSDVARITCAARLTPQGWRLNGTKMWSTFAGRAELVGLLARTDPDPALGYKGLSMFVVEKPAYRGHDFEFQPPGGGRLAGRAIATLGYRGMHSYELHFEDFLVPEQNLVGGAQGQGRGFYLQMDAFAYGRLQTAARALGVMQAAWEAASQYAQARTVFGKPLAGYALTQEKLALMAAQVGACRQAAYATARLLDQPGPGVANAGQMEASLVKMLACRQAEWVTREAQQLHGGMGYAEEFAVSRLYVDARVLSIFEGTDEVLALRVVLPALLKPFAE